MAGPADDRTRIALLSLVVVAALLFVAVRLPVVSIPLERDEGEYAYIAQRMLAGDLPYRDAFDQKPPGIFLAYALGFSLLGTSIEAIHLLLYAWTAVTAVALFGVVRRLRGDLAAGVAVLAFAVASADPRLGATAANTELFMLLPLVSSLLFLLRALEGDHAVDWLACGALVAAACWFKQVAAPQALLVVAAACATQRGLPRIARSLALLAAGAVLLSAPIGSFFALRGAWDPFLDAVLWHNLAYSGSQSAAQGWVNLRWALARIAPSLAALWLLAIPALVWPPLAGRRAWALLAGFAVTSGLGAALGLYFRPHYFIQTLPAIVAAVGVTAAACLERAPRRAFAPGVVLAAALVAAPPLLANAGLLAAGSPEAIARRIYGLNPFPESIAIADHIRRTSGPDETVLVVGSEPQILFYAERRSATRYIFFYPLTAPYAEALARQREVVAEFHRKRPRYVVWANVPTSLLLDAETETHVFEEVRALLERDYVLELVAHTTPDGEGYSFAYGAEARRLLRAARGRATDARWVALYRRTS